MNTNEFDAKYIAIDGRILSTHPFRGSSRHLISLIKCLDPNLVLILSNEKIDLIEIGLKRYKNIVFGNKNYVVWEQISLPVWLNKQAFSVDYLLSPNHTSPILSNVKKIIIVHDLIYFRYLYLSSPFGKNFLSSAYRSLTTLISILQKSKIITVSNYTKNMIARTFAINNSTIKIVSNPYLISGISKYTDVNRWRVLMVTGTMKHKNYERGIYGFFNSQLKNKYKLTIVGINPKLVTKLDDFHSLIDWRWGISDSQLSNLYLESEILLFPSIIEGFGIPLLEAMEFKVKICCSGNTVFPEICLSAATYFDPYSTNDIARALDECIMKLCPSMDYDKILRNFSTTKIKAQVDTLLLDL